MLKVVHDGSPPTEVQEHCCLCWEPTRYWHRASDVALCPKCAIKAKRADLPTKEEWITQHNALESMVKALDLPFSVLYRPLSPHLLGNLYQRFRQLGDHGGPK